MRLILAAAVALSVALQESDVKKVAPDAERVRKSTRKITETGRAAIEKALGRKLTPADLAAPRYECDATVPAVSPQAKTSVVVCFVDVQGPKGTIRLGVSVAVDDTTVHAVRVMRNGDDKAVEDPAFLDQFSGFEYGDALWMEPSNVEAGMKKAKAGDKDVDALIRMSRLMRAFGLDWEGMMEGLEAKQAGAGKRIAKLKEALRESDRLAQASSFLRDTQRKRFREYATGAAADLDEVAALIAKRKFGEAAERAETIGAERCAQCHGSYRRKFRFKREDVRLGNGFFSTQLDVAVPREDLRPLYQAVSDGVRKAVLLATGTP